ncbi:MAG: nuclear transport factor 2 family protein [Chloroflexi bacterium]|nr:nuclear transport factor 2 family protein [Chloroflexota bacterium]
MSSRDENAAAVRAYADAWRKGDTAALVGLYSDDFTLHYFGRSPLAGDHRGKAAALATLARVQQLTNRRLIEVHDVLVGDDHGAILAREHWERDGRTLDLQRVLVYHVQNGLLSECWLFDHDQRAVDEFWTDA